MTQRDLIGHGAQNAIEDRLPLAQLTFYNRLVLLKKWTGRGAVVEYPVSPTELREKLGKGLTVDTGILLPNTIHVSVSGISKTIIEYQPPEIVGLWFDGEADALHVPLPGMIMRREWSGRGSPTYSVYAVKERPVSPDDVLYKAPLPNITSSGTCWGTVKHPTPDKMDASNSLEEDWASFIGSRFGNHYCTGKSDAYHDDIRRQLRHLNDQSANEYPLHDLIEAFTLKEII